MADDDDEETFGGLYEDGHWAWDETTEALVFVSDLPPQLIEAIQLPTKVPTGTIEFRDDIDLIEQPSGAVGNGLIFCIAVEFPQLENVFDEQKCFPVSVFNAVTLPAQFGELQLQRGLQVGVHYTYTLFLDSLSASLSKEIEAGPTRYYNFTDSKFHTVFTDEWNIPLSRLEGFISWRLDDVKDIAIFTAPVNILSPVLINVLHIPTVDRFLRALILCCQYYLQISDEMANRIIELDTKVRTPQGDVVESEFRDNLSDLRLLVAKEYSTMLIGRPRLRQSLFQRNCAYFGIPKACIGLGTGGNDTKKFHHMGPQKKRRSLSDKDARLFETLLRMCVQIVWLALGRRAFNQIELEVSRVFKSEIFNSTEHTLHTGYIAKMAKEEKSVLLGHCVRHDKKMNTRSPLMNEVFCHRDIDYRLMGLGVIKCDQPSPRLLYMMQSLAGSEEHFTNLGIVLGIIGMPRSSYDTMLRPLPTATVEGKSKASISSRSCSSKSAASSSMRRSTLTVKKQYPDIVLPRKDSRVMPFPSYFNDEPEKIQPCSETQRRRWQNRLQRLLHPR